MFGIRIRRIHMFLGHQDPDLDPLVRGTDPDPDSSLFWNNACKIGFWHKFEQKIKFLRLKIMCLCVSCKKKIWEKFFFASLKSLKKGVVSGVGSVSGAGSISQGCGSADPEPDPHQNFTDPQHWSCVLSIWKVNEIIPVFQEKVFLALSFFINSVLTF